MPNRQQIGPTISAMWSPELPRPLPLLPIKRPPLLLQHPLQLPSSLYLFQPPSAGSARNSNALKLKPKELNARSSAKPMVVLLPPPQLLSSTTPPLNFNPKLNDLPTLLVSFPTRAPLPPSRTAPSSLLLLKLNPSLNLSNTPNAFELPLLSLGLLSSNLCPRRTMAPALLRRCLTSITMARNRQGDCRILRV